jgi:ABC-2 type transport system permease protein
MSLSAKPWPAFPAAAGGLPGRPQRSLVAMLAVWRVEMLKLAGTLKVRGIVAASILGPFLVVEFLERQMSTPGDTAFGQWVHTAGLAIPMTVLGFSAQWLLPALTAVVAGDIFSSDDRYGTWKTILTRSRSRGQLFTGKYLAAVSFAVGALLLLTVTNLAAGLLAGREPLVGLGGQVIPADHAAQLAVFSYLSDLPPLLGFTALAVLLSVASRNSVVAIGGTAGIGMLFQVIMLSNLPEWAQQTLLSRPFMAWHGFWAAPAFYGPFLWGLLTCAAWFGACGLAAWLIFRQRTIGPRS